MFCHNDGMPANMVLKEDQTVALIDLEYGGPNHAAYDLANLFNEYIGCDEFLDYKKNYPNEYLMKDWISFYLEEFNGEEPTKVGFKKNSSNNIDLIFVPGQYLRTLPGSCEVQPLRAPHLVHLGCHPSGQLSDRV